MTFSVPKKETDPNGIDQHTPGAKLDEGKLLAAIVIEDFPHALTAIAGIGTYGANKYTRQGWREVPNGVQRYTDAFMRHILKMAEEYIDPESGLPHLHHALWNLAAIVELKATATTPRPAGWNEDWPPESRGTSSSRLHALHLAAEEDA